LEWKYVHEIKLMYQVLSSTAGTGMFDQLVTQKVGHFGDVLSNQSLSMAY